MRIGCLLVFLWALLPTLAADGPPKKPEGPTFQVPYRLSDTKHVLVRAKINGTGPYNFLLDTGAPSLYVSTAVAKKLGVEADGKGSGTFERFEIEGGVVIEKVKGIIDDPFQLEGMNKMGLGGVTLHGVIGYNVLARYRIGFDFTKDKMPWTTLDFEPPAAEGLAGNKGGVDALGGLVKIMAAMIGKQLEREIRYRGFLGVELAEKDGMVTIAAVLDDSPAKAAKLKAGDKITHVGAEEVTKAADVHRLLAKTIADDHVELTVIRNGEKQSLTVRLGKGL